MKRSPSPKHENWQNAIIGRLCAQSSKMVVLFDYDDLSSTMAIFERFVGYGFDVYDYTDNLSLYYYLERVWLSNSIKDSYKLLIRVSFELAENAKLPYSVLSNAEIIGFRLEDFFEGISVKAIKELSSKCYDKLYDLLGTTAESDLSYNDSIDFLTRRVFGIDVSGITGEVHVWAVLFKLHYSDTELPEFAVNKLRYAGTGYLNGYDIDLEQALRSSDYFYAFLQKEWERFVDQHRCSDPRLKVLPFDHPDLKVYTDNFFAEGLLRRIRIDHIKADDLGWISCGIELQEPVITEQIESIMSALRTHLPEANCSYRVWKKYAKDYAGLLYMIFNSGSSLETDGASELRDEINTRFQSWVQQHYDSLASLPSRNPVMVHQIARSIVHQRDENANSKTALIVLDGMSYDQWLCIKAELDLGECDLHEEALFAWAPTLTSISRQSIFSASIPLYIGKNIGSTARESNHWKRFWEDNGLGSQSVHYLRMDGTVDISAELEKQVNLKSASVIGIVLNVIDDIMHGMNLGSAGMHSQIKHWVSIGHFSTLLRALLDHSFEVWITSDHGNLECEGIGNIADGALSETKASRVRIYQSETLRDQALLKSETSLAWTPKGLPSDLYCLFAPYRASYHAAGKKLVSHGGISLEEIMVPLVKINRKNI